MSSRRLIRVTPQVPNSVLSLDGFCSRNEDSTDGIWILNVRSVQLSPFRSNCGGSHACGSATCLRDHAGSIGRLPRPFHARYALDFRGAFGAAGCRRCRFVLASGAGVGCRYFIALDTSPSLCRPADPKLPQSRCGQFLPKRSQHRALRAGLRALGVQLSTGTWCRRTGRRPGPLRRLGSSISSRTLPIGHCRRRRRRRDIVVGRRIAHGADDQRAPDHLGRASLWLVNCEQPTPTPVTRPGSCENSLRYSDERQADSIAPSRFQSREDSVRRGGDRLHCSQHFANRRGIGSRESRRHST